jgi:hypothetical protein
MKEYFLIIFTARKSTSPNRPTEQKKCSGHVLPLFSFPLPKNHHPPPPFCLPDTSATKLEAAVLPPNKTHKSMKVNSSLQMHHDNR